MEEDYFEILCPLCCGDMEVWEENKYGNCSTCQTDNNSFYVGFDGETEIVSSNCTRLTKENAPRIKGYEIESENEGVITYKPTNKS